MLTFSFYTCLVLFILVCLFMILLILIQKGRGGGLASAFGGAGGNTAFGSKTGDVLTWATSIVFGIFLILAVALNLMSNALDKRYRDDLAAAQRAAIQARQPQPPAMPALPGQSPEPAAAPAAPSATPLVEPAAPAAPPATQP